VQAVDQLEAKPESAGRKESLQEEIIAVNAGQDVDVLAVAKHCKSRLSSRQDCGLKNGIKF
jgi:hypothetical protein